MMNLLVDPLTDECYYEEYEVNSMEKGELSATEVSG